MHPVLTFGYGNTQSAAPNIRIIPELESGPKNNILGIYL